jgi:stage III sporulation protein AF
LLLATFIDLVLPGSTMQRYVKTVVSLFILLTLLSPVFKLFQAAWEPEKLLADAAVKQEAYSSAIDQQVRAATSLEAINRKAEEMRQLQSSQSRRIVEKQLASEMKVVVEQKQQGVSVKSIQVSVAANRQGQMDIISVNMTVGLPEQGKMAPQPDKTENSTVVQIRPIERIAISMDPIGNNSSRAASAPKQSPVQLERSRTAIQQTLQEQWRIKPEQVHITFDAMEGVAR